MPAFSHVPCRRRSPISRNPCRSWAPSFAGALMLAVLAILMRELFSGRALAAAPGRTFDSVEDVVMTPATASDDDLDSDPDAG